MSERIVNDPSQHGWVEVDGKWVWDASGGGGRWEQNGDDIYYDAGNVGIGTDSPFGGVVKLDVAGDIAMDGGSRGILGNCGYNNGWKRIKDGSGFSIVDSGAGLTFRYLTSGSAGENLDSLFGSEPAFTIDATGKCEFSGRVASSGSASYVKYELHQDSGFTYLAQTPTEFSIQPNGEVSKQFAIDLSSGNATFSGTVDAAGFTINGVPISGGSGGLPDGGYTYGWTITATDFIATSDERLKDNITTAPVGLIDSLKGREWDWKESGEKGSGVVAQELEQVLPHLVHEDDEGMKSVAYNGLIAYLVEELKDCRDRLAVLEAKE